MKRPGRRPRRSRPRPYVRPRHRLEGRSTSRHGRGRFHRELHVLPCFAGHSDSDTIVSELMAEISCGHTGHITSLAELLARLGRLDEARPDFLLVPGPRDVLAKVAARYGISLD